MNKAENNEQKFSPKPEIINLNKNFRKILNFKIKK
jgi:hypothetical protein